MSSEPVEHLTLEPVRHPETGVLHWVIDPAAWRDAAACGLELPTDPECETATARGDLDPCPEWDTDLDWGASSRNVCVECFVVVTKALQTDGAING